MTDTKHASSTPATPEPQSSYEKGLSTRREVLGDKWVDRSLARRTEFNTEFQELITRYAWDEIWGRPGLSRQMRRVMVLSVTMSLGRWEEFELHVRAALQATDGTGLSVEELKEVLLQNAIYAGVPASNTAFNLAQDILNKLQG
jgi:3-oxoadipate enol-lactonase